MFCIIDSSPTVACLAFALDSDLTFLSATSFTYVAKLAAEEGSFSIRVGGNPDTSW